MRKILFLLTLAMAFNMASAQTYYYYERTEYPNGPYYFDQSLDFVNVSINLEEKKKEVNKLRELNMRQVRDMRNEHRFTKTYPEKIGDGWHGAVIIGGDEYMGIRTVLVEQGKVRRVVWDDWMEEELTFSGPIQKAKAEIKIKGGKGPLGGIVEVFFVYSMGNDPGMAEAPLKAGRACFWTSIQEEELGKIYIVFEDAVLGPFTEHRDWNKSPECGGTQQINVIYKPGKYYFKAVRKASDSPDEEGHTLIRGRIEIKEGGCTLFEVFEPGAKRKGSSNSEEK